MTTMKYQPIIYLDMDEVICDFIGGACKLFGISREDLEECRIPGEWNITPALSKSIGTDISQEFFWQRIKEQGISFWAELNCLPDAIELKDYLNSTRIEWHIVTTPGNFEASETGKTRWIRKFMGQHFNKFHLTPYKHLLSRTHTVLIDDAEHNIIKFIHNSPAPGRAILYPHQGNFLHKQVPNALNQTIIEIEKFLVQYPDYRSKLC